MQRPGPRYSRVAAGPGFLESHARARAYWAETQRRFRWSLSARETGRIPRKVGGSGATGAGNRDMQSPCHRRSPTS